MHKRSLKLRHDFLASDGPGRAPAERAVCFQGRSRRPVGQASSLTVRAASLPSVPQGEARRKENLNTGHGWPVNRQAGCLTHVHDPSPPIASRDAAPFDFVFSAPENPRLMKQLFSRCAGPTPPERFAC